MENCAEDVDIIKSDTEDIVTSDDPTSDDDTGRSAFIKRSQRRAWNNVLILNSCILLGGIGYGGVGSVKSSLLTDDGLGVWTMAAENITTVILIVFAVLVISKLGLKRTIILYFATMALYAAANFYPSWYTLMPAAILAGIGEGVGYIGDYAYIARMAGLYVGLTKMAPDGSDLSRIRARFFSTLAVTGELALILGNTLSSLILGYHVTKDNVTEEQLALCGADYCNQDFSSSSNSSDDDSSSSADNAHVYALCGVSLVLVLLACGLTYFLDDVGPTEDTSGSRSSPFMAIVATLRQLIAPRQLLLIATTIINASGSGFWSVEFSKGYVTCAFGVQYVGYVMGCYGIVSAISTFLIGWFAGGRYRVAPLVVIFLTKLAVQISLLYWKPSTDSWAALFIITGVWGFTASGDSLILALYGDLFRSNLEAAYSGEEFYSLLGYVIIDVTSNVMCTADKIYLQIGLIVAGLLGYLVVEVHNMRGKKTN